MGQIVGFVEPYEDHRETSQQRKGNINPVAKCRRGSERVEDHSPEQCVNEPRMHKSRGNSVVDGSNDNSSEREYLSKR